MFNGAPPAMPIPGRTQAALVAIVATSIQASATAQSASLEEVLGSERDLWGEAARRQPDGPSFEAFADLLPPLRYVNAAFREAPLVLSDPLGGPKVRLAGDGSGLLQRAELATWHDVEAPPVGFLVMDRSSTRPDADWRPFGGRERLVEEPKLRDGWIPLVTFREAHAALEVAAVPPSAARGEVLVHVAIRALEAPIRFALELGAEATRRSAFSSGWTVSGSRAWVEIAPGAVHTALVAAGPRLPEAPDLATALESRGVLVDRLLADGAELAAAAWRHALDGEFALETPEPRVNAAWKATVAGTLALFEGDTLLYAVQNLYHQTFQAECGDALRALWRYAVPGAERGLEPLLSRPQQAGIGAHDVAFKAMLLREWWELARGRLRDRAAAAGAANLLHDREALRDRLVACADALVAEFEPWLGRLDAASGLLPKQAYCGDITEPVDSLHTNASFWRGVRDLSLICEDAGGALGRDHASRLAISAVQLRAKIHAAAEASVRRDVAPPFVPMALFGSEQPYEHLTASMTGSYWNLVSPYAAASGVFLKGHPLQDALIRYPEMHGGLCMGMVRFDQHSGLFANTEGVDDLYTLRRAELLLRDDRPDDALVAFYGKLAQGMTRDTFVSGEGSSLRPLDGHGRPLYLPPNAAGSAFFLTLLRGMVVLEVDGDEDGRSDELRLAHATPRHWFREPGARLEVRGAPTSFGAVSFRLERSANGEELRGEVTLPTGRPDRVRLRLRIPDRMMLGTVVDGAGNEVSRSDRETLLLDGAAATISLVAKLKSPEKERAAPEAGRRD
jgi:hypothetical protein